MFKFGLKLWSSNNNYVREAVRLYEKKVYEYIELYIRPDVNDEQISLWKKLDIPYVLHAPHFQDGFNLAKREQQKSNHTIIKKTQEIADLLGADKIIVHPGVDGDTAETVRQLKEISDSRILIENKPYYAFDNFICNGAFTEEIKFILDNTNTGFCLDIGHSFNAANAKKISPFDYLKEFIKLKPKMYHLTDGDYKDVHDRHDHFGKGNYDLKAIIDILPDDCFMTIETVKDFKDSLDDFKRDIDFLKDMLLLKEFEIKIAEDTDMMDVFNLSNDPIVRKNSFNQKPIALEDHQKWFKQKIEDKNCIFYTIRNSKNELIGQIRFEKTDEDTNTYLISISLGETSRGLGIGSKLLEKVSAKVLKENKIEKIYAYIKESNEASLRSFKKAGYSVAKKEGNKLILEVTNHQNSQ